MCSRLRRGMSIALAVCVVWWAAGLRAQSPAPTVPGPVADTSPMNCWWKPDKRAVRVAEPFGLTLTCRVMETAAVAVVLNLTDIEPASIELTPFEMLDGTRHEDIVAGPWRYVQYVYTVRLLGDEFFGQDVAIPATNVTFRIQSRGEETVEGNEHRYVLPPIPIRILSLVPAQADDIQDPAIGTFGDVEARRFRASIELVASAIFFGFAAIAAAMAALRVRERLRTGGPVVPQTAPVPAALGWCVREVERVRAEALRDGWSSSLAARAMAPFRVAGAIALNQPISQTRVTSDTPAREGQIALRHGLLRRRHAVVSAPVTAETIDRLRAASRPLATPQDVLDQIRAALGALTVVRYGREPVVDAQMLDQTLGHGSRALRRLRSARRWPRRAVGVVSTWASRLGIGAWRG